MKKLIDLFHQFIVRIHNKRIPLVEQWWPHKKVVLCSDEVSSLVLTLQIVNKGISVSKDQILCLNWALEATAIKWDRKKLMSNLRKFGEEVMEHKAMRNYTSTTRIVVEIADFDT